MNKIDLTYDESSPQLTKNLVELGVKRNASILAALLTTLQNTPNNATDDQIEAFISMAIIVWNEQGLLAIENLYDFFLERFVVSPSFENN